MPNNKNVREQMRNWQLQQKQEGQKELRDKYEYMNDKYQQMKSDYTNFNNVHKDMDNEAIYNKSSDLADKNPYMRYELNNTFKNKDDKKEK
ncbi:MAG: hypothetical protein GX289_05230 [Tissierellia bacterium]|jgi:hypothetical protein|nr:hypothetical protein [Tissierellia bacterium]